jgi:hypothetical protein
MPQREVVGPGGAPTETTPAGADAVRVGDGEGGGARRSREPDRGLLETRPSWDSEKRNECRRIEVSSRASARLPARHEGEVRRLAKFQPAGHESSTFLSWTPEGPSTPP